MTMKHLSIVNFLASVCKNLNQFCKYMDEMGPYNNKDSTRTQPVLPTHESFLLFHLFSGVADKGGPHFGHKVPVEDRLLLEGPQDQHGPPLEEKERTASVSGGVCACACVCVCAHAHMHVNV